MIETGRIDTASMVTHRFSLAEVTLVLSKLTYRRTRRRQRGNFTAVTSSAA